MDYACPACGENLKRRKLSQSIIAKMEIDCPKCMARLQLNLHGVESAALIGSFATFVALGLLAYRTQSQALFFIAAVGGASGLAITQVLERTWLKGWPRYVLKPPA